MRACVRACVCVCFIFIVRLKPTFVPADSLIVQEKKEKKHKDKHRDKYSEAGVKTEDVKTEIDEIVEEDDLKPSGAIPSGLDGMQPPRAREMPPAPEVIDPLNSGVCYL